MHQLFLGNGRDEARRRGAEVHEEILADIAKIEAVKQCLYGDSTPALNLILETPPLRPFN